MTNSLTQKTCTESCYSEVQLHASDRVQTTRNLRSRKIIAKGDPHGIQATLNRMKNAKQSKESFREDTQPLTLLR